MRRLWTKNLVTDTAKAQKILNTDCHWMRVAIAASRCAEGRTAENPPVGCAIVSAAGQLLSVGHTGKGGRPHAETEAMAKSPAALLAGATAYVTLEPCAHTGQTGPCADALIACKIARVVIAVADPDKRVNGAGIKRLRDAGIAVEIDVCAAEAARVLTGFLMRQTASRPFVTWKTATSLDGMIALAELPIDAEGRLDLPAAMQAMAAAGCNHVMVEAGAGLSGSLFSHDLIDRIVWTQSHHLIGGDAIPAIGGMSTLALPDRTHYILSDEGRLGDDRWLVFDRRSGEN